MNLCSVVAEVQFEESRIEGIKFLVENGANINAKNNAGVRFMLREFKIRCNIIDFALKFQIRHGSKYLRSNV